MMATRLFIITIADEKDADGNAVTSYDIRIVYCEDESYTDCYFRKLPLRTTISKITLHMDGTAEDGIPYATYLTRMAGKTETSTLVMSSLVDGASWS